MLFCLVMFSMKVLMKLTDCAHHRLCVLCLDDIPQELMSFSVRMSLLPVACFRDADHVDFHLYIFIH